MLLISIAPHLHSREGCNPGWNPTEKPLDSDRDKSILIEDIVVDNTWEGSMNFQFEARQPAGLRHKVFVSYHHANDQFYRNQFELLFADIYNVIVSKSVQIGDIESHLTADTIRNTIRDNYLRDSTVTVVLVGEQTWQRKHVDWEIGSSIRDTEYNPRSGLLGILLPTYPDSTQNEYYPQTVPPRLNDTVVCGYATMYHWSDDPKTVQLWIHQAFERRFEIDPDNSFPSFLNNRSGDRWYR